MYDLTPTILKAYPEILPTLRMSTAPPIARDRLSGLARLPNAIMNALEAGRVPRRPDLEVALASICGVLSKLLERDIFPWLAEASVPTEAERLRASTIVADRLCGSQANPLIRNAQEQRQLELIERFLMRRGYRRQTHPGSNATNLEAGTFAFRMNLPVGHVRRVNIPIDVVIQPKAAHPGDFPILIEAKSAGDFTNTNKRCKEEAT
ncbi:MAG: XamI family restriction endonuclease, partial [Dehalococcoidia bacterium]